MDDRLPCRSAAVIKLSTSVPVKWTRLPFVFISTVTVQLGKAQKHIQIWPVNWDCVEHAFPFLEIDLWNF